MSPSTAVQGILAAYAPLEIDRRHLSPAGAGIRARQTEVVRTVASTDILLKQSHCPSLEPGFLKAAYIHRRNPKPVEGVKNSLGLQVHRGRENQRQMGDGWMCWCVGTGKQTKSRFRVPTSTSENPNATSCASVACAESEQIEWRLPLLPSLHTMQALRQWLGAATFIMCESKQLLVLK